MNRLIKRWGPPLILLIAQLGYGHTHDGHASWLDWRTDPEFRSTTFRPFIKLDAPSPYLNIRYADFTIDPTFLRQKVSEFSGALPIIINGKSVTIRERHSNDGRTLAKAYLAQEFAQLGYKTTLQNFRSGSNFIAERAGSDPSKVLILSAHLDTVDTAGADDDGSGVISMLAIAHALKDRKLKHTLRIIGFDREEWGLLGSIAYVTEASKTAEWANVIGDINIEMVGYNSREDGAFHVIDCGRKDSTSLSGFVMGAVQSLQIPLKRVSACTDRSDHASFWDKSKGAVVVSQNFFGGDPDPCYHDTCDAVENVNFKYMAQVTRALAAATAAIVSP